MKPKFERVEIRRLVDPSGDYYMSAGMLAFALSKLMDSAEPYRSDGRWGSQGVHEILCNYDGCTNSWSTAWHNTRRGFPQGMDNFSFIRREMQDCILKAMFRQSPDCERWRKEQKISFETKLLLPIGNAQAERDAWISFDGIGDMWMGGLRGRQFKKSYNSCHRHVKTICFPELFINRKMDVHVYLAIAQRSEFKRDGQSVSRWSAARSEVQWDPQWHPQKESFAEFISRVVAEIDVLCVPRRIP